MPTLSDELTIREKEVAALVATGLSTKETGYKLGITFSTAATHRWNAMKKLKARNTAELTRAAIRLGLLDA